MAPRVSGGVAHAMAVSVGVGADDRAALSTKAVNCAADLGLNRGHFVRTIWSRSCGKSGPGTALIPQALTQPDPAFVIAHFEARDVSMIMAA